MDRYWPNFNDRFLGLSLTNANCDGDIWQGGICPGDIDVYKLRISQLILTWFLPNFLNPCFWGPKFLGTQTFLNQTFFDSQYFFYLKYFWPKRATEIVISRLKFTQDLGLKCQTPLRLKAWVKEVEGLFYWDFLFEPKKLDQIFSRAFFSTKFFLTNIFFRIKFFSDKKILFFGPKNYLLTKQFFSCQNL